jgi:redox-sensitive bicupin YhaK (pirin superfamily)
MTTIDVRRAADRPLTRTPWLRSRHSFSFAAHRDPSNTHHGILLVNNDDIVAPGTGFDTHPHRDMEIVTCTSSPRAATSPSKAPAS